MPSYQLFNKNGDIENIIIAGLGYVAALKYEGLIGDFIDISKIQNPVSLRRNEKGHFVPSLPRLAKMKSILPKSITTEEVMKQVEILNEKIANIEKQATQQTNDVNSAILAIKGFMMEIPNIQKTLLELQDMVKPK